MTDPAAKSAADPGVVVQHIAADLRTAGVRAGGVLMVHSSLSSMGHVVGGPETVIRGLIEALGPEGTLLMPALSYEHVTTKNPIFDARRTPSNVGAMPEYFRKRAGTRRSIHPTHSVCGIGPRTAEMLDDHPQDRTPCGPNSPFHKLRDVGGQILMLGCGLRPNTSMHAIEELVKPPYLFGHEKTYVLIYPDGCQEERVYMAHGFRHWIQRYDRVAQVLAYPALREAQVLAATVHLIDVPALWQAALAALERDELFFVDRDVPGLA